MACCRHANRDATSTSELGVRLDALEPMCEASALLREKCCSKDLVPERQFVSGDALRDVIIGLSDGLMVPFALTAGLSSLGDSKLVYQGGLAELVAGSISMGVGGFLSAQSEQHIFRYRQSTLTKQWLLACPSQIDKKTRELLKPYGVSNTTCHEIAADLSRANLNNVEERKTESGVVPLVLSLEEGLEVVPTKRLIMSATTIGLSYFLGGIIPIIPYLCVSNALQGLYWSILATGLILLIFGASKTWLTGASRSPLGVIWGALSTLAVGSAAAAASYGIVRGLSHA